MATEDVLAVPVSPIGSHEASPAAYLLPTSKFASLREQIEKAAALQEDWKGSTRGRIHSFRITPMPGQWLSLDGVHLDGSPDTAAVSHHDLEEATTTSGATPARTTGILEVDLEEVSLAGVDHSELVISIMPPGPAKSTDGPLPDGHLYANGYYSGFGRVPFESSTIQFPTLLSGS